MSSRELKKWLALAALCALLLALTGCACKHETTETINALEPLCLTDGYTGDIICSSCDEVLTPGEVIPATGHTEGEPTGVLSATCTAEGYTGDIPCAICGEILTKGEAVAMLPHTPDEPVGAMDATCTEDGFTGDIACIDCGAIITPGEIIPKLEHTPGSAAATNATCTEDGFTGDIHCTVCNELITGEVIPATGHSEAAPIDAAAATCVEDGHTGKILCAVCGELLDEGQIIPASGHSIIALSCEESAYTGCSVCEETFLTAHQFEDDACVLCGWMTPGLYVYGKLEADWQTLVDNGSVIVENGRLIGVKGDMQRGKLVIDESVTAIDSLVTLTLNEVWIPRSVSEWGEAPFDGQHGIHTIRLFCAPLDSTIFDGITSIYLGK